MGFSRSQKASINGGIILLDFERRFLGLPWRQLGKPYTPISPPVAFCIIPQSSKFPSWFPSLSDVLIFFHIFYPYNSWWDPYNNRSQIRPSRRPYLYRAPGPCRTCLLSRLDHRPIGPSNRAKHVFHRRRTVHCTFGGFQLVMGVPPNGWFIMGNPMKMDDDWGYPYFRKLPFLFIGMNMHMMMRQSYMCTMRCENPELWTDNTPAISSRWIICNWIYKALCIW